MRVIMFFMISNGNENYIYYGLSQVINVEHGTTCGRLFYVTIVLYYTAVGKSTTYYINMV